MKNIEVAELLNEIADYLEFADDTYRVRAYRKAALVIEGLSEDIGQVWKDGKLEELPGIGEGIAKKIDEFLKTGKLEYIDDLKKKTPVDMEGLGKIEGIGPKTILKLYRRLKVRNVADLEKAAKQGKIQKLEGLGPVAERNILKSIEFARKTKERVPLGFALGSAEEVATFLKKLKDVERVGIAGSTRRMKETIGDIDILATLKPEKNKVFLGPENSKNFLGNPEKVIDFFAKMPNVADVLAKGATKSSIRLREGIQVDLRVLDDNIFGAALLYFTGNKEHNIILRRIAIEKGLKLSEYGLFSNKTNKVVAGRAWTISSLK